jgi:hypothetical protein
LYQVSEKLKISTLDVALFLPMQTDHLLIDATLDDFIAHLTKIRATYGNIVVAHCKAEGDGLFGLVKLPGVVQIPEVGGTGVEHICAIFTSERYKILVLPK